MTATLLQTLDDLKAKGFSPADRAKVAYEWMAWAVHFHGSCPDHQVSTHHKRCHKLFELFKQSLDQLHTPDQLKMLDHRDSDPITYGAMMRAHIAQVFELPLDALSENGSFQAKADFLTRYTEELNSQRFSNAVGDNWTSVISGATPPMWLTIDNMKMTERDLELYLLSKMPQASSQFPPPSNLTLEQSHALLDDALARAHIPLCALDTFSATSPAACYALSQSLHRVCDALDQVGAPGVGFNAIHMKVDYPLADGCGGMMLRPQPAPTMPLSAPVLVMSNQCGWEYEEVIIHELLHAHDALLGSVAQEEFDSSLMLSKSSLHDAPLWKAWQQLATSLDNLATDQSVEQKKQLAQQGMKQRWSKSGIMPHDLDQEIQRWKKSTHPDKDRHLHKAFVQLYASTPYASTAPFRAAAMVAECLLLKKIGTAPVFHTFVQEFDQVFQALVPAKKSRSQKPTTEIYGQGYFESLSEKMARSIQSTLDVLPSSQLPTNPYAARTLVYADQSLSHQISACWQEFFANPCVQDAYGILHAAAPDLNNLKTHIEAQRQKRSAQQLRPKSAP